MRSLVSRCGFTLVELLVVVAIIGILSVIALSSFTSSQVRSRDATRKSDINQISKALEMFFSDHGRYPAADANGNIKACPFALMGANDISVSCVWGDDENPMTDNKSVYFRTIPHDPSGSQYFYRTLNNNQSFQLYAHLENEKDPSCIEPTCLTEPVGVDCGNVCNFARTSADVSPNDN